MRKLSILAMAAVIAVAFATPSMSNARQGQEVSSNNCDQSQKQVAPSAWDRIMKSDPSGRMENPSLRGVNENVGG